MIASIFCVAKLKSAGQYEETYLPPCSLWLLPLVVLIWVKNSGMLA